MDIIITTGIKTSGMDGHMRSGYYKQGFNLCILINKKKYVVSFYIPIWISHRYNKYQFRFTKKIRLCKN